MHGLAILMLLATFLIGLAMIVFWFWTLIDCVTSKRLTDTQKVIWALVIVLVGTIGSLIYFFAGRLKVYVPPQQYYPVQAYDQPQDEQPHVESYAAYQDGYRAQSVAQQNLSDEVMPINEENPSQQAQLQYEQMQISYPE